MPAVYKVKERMKRGRERRGKNNGIRHGEEKARRLHERERWEGGRMIREGDREGGGEND